MTEMKFIRVRERHRKGQILFWIRAIIRLGTKMSMRVEPTKVRISTPRVRSRLSQTRMRDLSLLVTSWMVCLVYKTLENKKDPDADMFKTRYRLDDTINLGRKSNLSILNDKSQILDDGEGDLMQELDARYGSALIDL